MNGESMTHASMTSPLAGKVAERSARHGDVSSTRPAPDPPPAKPGEGKPQQFRRDKRDVHGWIVLDKAVGMTSTQAVGAIKRLFSCKRAGHAGTLDPLASGCLPIALGEATKTVPFVMDGRKVYRFTVRWGEERDTDDADGRVVAASDARPDRAAIEALLPRYTGTIAQVPPQYSAIKIDGERAYDLARDGETVDLAGPAGRNSPPRAGERARCRYRRVRGRMRQGHLCPLARPRHRPGARMSADISRRYGARRSARSAKTT